MAGLFVSFEGVDGVGKTTQVERLRQYLESRDRTVLVTREPGGTPLGAALRRLLLHNIAEDAADIAPRAEALIFAADRAQHVAETIRPALDRGEIVITDRYLDSSLAYQAGGRELTAAEIRDLSLWATNGLLPVRTYLLDMDPAASHTRLQHDADRMESAGDDFQSRTRQAFLDLAAAEPNRFRVIDAAQTIDRVWERIREDIDALLAVTVGSDESAKPSGSADPVELSDPVGTSEPAEGDSR
ncbi:thymidylate kinase [Bifidobacterium margollesii]|uniref:Thymidylate kinase n=1 Tax=Bifidobacterium margollesii TaxID=2020964 RepID=A0A2N5J843_9BIFI|nr:dTMP kinase [Bifidobacterium margollesii]PLS30383.1 thymidylate kinase [Bifidobacterium margollesii]